MATSVPAPMAMPEVGLGEGGGVVDAVADHRHPPALVLQLGDLGGLVAGQHLGDDGVDAELAGDAPGGGLVVAGEHDDLDPELVQRGHRGGGGGARGVGERDQPGRAAVDGDQHGGPAGRGELLAAGGELAEVDALALACSRRLPTATRWPSTVAIAPWPGTFSNPVAASRSTPRSSAWATIAWARGCSDSRSTAATSASSSSSSMPSATHVGDLGFALGQGAGLVHHHGVDAARRSPARWRS